ncbi:hypothetical protein [Flavisphingomonas formosensis]|uniref:hypothetical protein n=1 Tax=Flavisphingomonas formosensis TaxID=861534 RepID=UPI0012FB1098|nr:hypothetical protein [Sphingomonas formosensis]
MTDHHAIRGYLTIGPHHLPEAMSLAAALTEIEPLDDAARAAASFSGGPFPLAGLESKETLDGADLTALLKAARAG